jgi:hypothetical protein
MDITGKQNGNVSSDIDLSSSFTGDLDHYLGLFSGGSGDAYPIGQDWGGDIDLVREEALEITHGFNLQLNDSESSIIRWAQGEVGKRRRGGTVPIEKTQYVTHEDFEPGTQRDAFLLIYGYAETLFSKHDVHLKQKALDFFFKHKNNDGFTFAEAATCIDPSIRVDVIQLRIQFEFWVRDWCLVMPDKADELPERVASSARLYGNMVGVTIATAAWFEPGIELNRLMNFVKQSNPFARDPEIIDSIKNLTAYHIISEGDVGGVSRYYTTGKNPILKLQEIISERGKVSSSFNKTHWSQLF